MKWQTESRILLFAFVAMIVFSLFGMFMSVRQSSGWAEQRRACVQRGGVPWQAKNSGDPICLKHEALIMENR